jgi:hypothetical protein
MNDDKPAEFHISSVDKCRLTKITEMKKSQKWLVRGKYDYDVQPGNIEGGKQGAVSFHSSIIHFGTFGLTA